MAKLIYESDENYLKKNKKKYLIGIDEVGRGPLAGPVVAASVSVFSADCNESFFKYLDENINDSKKLTQKKRQKIINELGLKVNELSPHKKIRFKHEKTGLCLCLAQISERVIDKINIHHATLEAMDNAYKYQKISAKDCFVLVDGKFIPPKIKAPSIALIKGDQRSYLIGLASIFAKEYRDSYMQQLAGKYTGYGWESNSGYPTKKHYEGIKKYGPSPYHRLSFKGVSEEHRQ